VHGVKPLVGAELKGGGAGGFGLHRQAGGAGVGGGPGGRPRTSARPAPQRRALGITYRSRSCQKQPRLQDAGTVTVGGAAREIPAAVGGGKWSTGPGGCGGSARPASAPVRPARRSAAGHVELPGTSASWVPVARFSAAHRRRSTRSRYRRIPPSSLASRFHNAPNRRLHRPSGPGQQSGLPLRSIPLELGHLGNPVRVEQTRWPRRGRPAPPGACSPSRPPVNRRRDGRSCPASGRYGAMARSLPLADQSLPAGYQG
jgi:hypothetical protein